MPPSRGSSPDARRPPGGRHRRVPPLCPSALGLRVAPLSARRGAPADRLLRPALRAAGSRVGSTPARAVAAADAPSLPGLPASAAPVRRLRPCLLHRCRHAVRRPRGRGGAGRAGGNDAPRLLRLDACGASLRAPDGVARLRGAARGWPLLRRRLRRRSPRALLDARPRGGRHGRCGRGGGARRRVARRELSQPVPRELPPDAGALARLLHPAVLVSSVHAPAAGARQGSRERTPVDRGERWWAGRWSTRGAAGRAAGQASRRARPRRLHATAPHRCRNRHQAPAPALARAGDARGAAAPPRCLAGVRPPGRRRRGCLLQPRGARPRGGDRHHLRAT